VDFATGAANARATVGIYVYPEVEVLDFAGPFEVFSTASRVFARNHPDATAPLNRRRNRWRLARSRRPRGDAALRDRRTPAARHPSRPGGVHERELAKPRVIEWIAHQHAGTQLTASVCMGAFLLGAAGLLGGLEVTTHWEDAADLGHAFPNARVCGGVRWTKHERVMTSAGISAGLDMSLDVVARFAGQDLAERTARQMDYDWRKRT
jgi:transcriptional regulator GlxA family with amidase domain